MGGENRLNFEVEEKNNQDDNCTLSSSMPGGGTGTSHGGVNRDLNDDSLDKTRGKHPMTNSTK